MRILLKPNSEPGLAAAATPAATIGDILRNFNPQAAQPRATNLQELQVALAPVARIVPELNIYDIISPDGKREFPRTVAALANLGIMLRACDAMRAVEADNYTVQQGVIEAYNLFTHQQNGANKLNIEQFVRLAKLYMPVAGNPDAELAVATTIIYGDIFKMPAMKALLKERVGDGQAADHDTALRAAFLPENREKFRNELPTFFALPSEWQARISGEVINGVNLGHVLQVENCAAALKGLESIVKADPQNALLWLLSSVCDISGVRANEKDLNSVTGSTMINAILGRDLLIAAKRALELRTSGVEACFDGIHADIAKSPFYAPIAASGLSSDEQAVVYRLARITSMEAFGKNIDNLIVAWKSLSTTEQKTLSDSVMNSGMDSANPKAVISYLPYISTSMYETHFPGVEGLTKGLKCMAHAIDTVNSFLSTDAADAAKGKGHIDVSMQIAWFTKLSKMTREQLLEADARGGIQFAVTAPQGKPGEKVVPVLDVK